MRNIEKGRHTSPKATRPIDRGGERHGARYTQTCNTSSVGQRGNGEQGRDEHSECTQAVEIEEQPPIRHPERVPHLTWSEINI